MSSSVSSPSPMYYFTLGLGCTGIPFATMALWSEWQLSAGQNPIDGFGNAGAIGMIIGYTLLFAARLITWNRVPRRTQQAVQQVVDLILVMAIIFAILVIVLSFFVDGRNKFLAEVFGVFACLCHIATAFWLLKYQHETA